MNEELVVRFNNKEYANWVKAGQCLYILKDALHPYTDEQMRAFHRALLRGNPRLGEQCPRSCQSGDIKTWQKYSHVLRLIYGDLYSLNIQDEIFRACGLCLQWKSEILRHHRQPGSTLNWDNCSPPAWRTNYWELAKAYMPRGQAHVNAAHECDPSALLNLINFCDCFASVDVHASHVRELIRCRNDLMHSPDLHVKEAWMKKFKVVLRRFVQLFSQVPSMALAEPRLARMLAVDLSICVLDTVDYTEMALAADSLVYHIGLRPESISQWEADLLQERLRELRHLAEDETVDTEQLMMLDGFLQENKDLSQRFSAELQAIRTLGTGQKKS